MIDWTWNWMTKLPPIWQGGFGSCEACSACYAIAMRAYIQGYPLRMLSQLYLYWYGQGGAYNTNHQVGAGMGSGVAVQVYTGCCLESLHPRPAWQGVDTTTQAYSDSCWAAVRRAPSAAAEADAGNQIVAVENVDWAWFAPLYNGTLDDMVVKAQAALDAGYILTAWCPPNHEVCILGYNQYGWLAPDSRSQNAESNSYGWTTIIPDVIVRNVIYKNATLGPKPMPLPKPGPVPPPPLPPVPKGNAMTIQQLQAWANSLVAGQVSQVQVDTGKSLAAQLVPDAPGPTPGPLPAGAWKIVAPDISVHLTAGGIKWRAGDWTNGRMAVWREGASSFGITASELYYPGTGEMVFTKHPTMGTWQYAYSGNTWIDYKSTPPGYV